MISIYLRAPDGTRLESLHTEDEVAAEEQYLRLILAHFGRVGAVVLEPGAAATVPAEYRLDDDWSHPCRENEPLRAAQIWGHPMPAAPTVAQVRALTKVSGKTRGEMAALAGYGKDAWDSWSAAPDNKKHRSMPWSAYFTAQVRAGLHPELRWPPRREAGGT